MAHLVVPYLQHPVLASVMGELVLEVVVPWSEQNWKELDSPVAITKLWGRSGPFNSRLNNDWITGRSVKQTSLNPDTDAH